MFSVVARKLHSGGPLTKNASVAATEVIRQAILDGRLPPGRRLKEEELAQELGISRTPVREALLMLQAEALVDATPNRGAAVRSYSVEDLTDLYQLRALLEGYAARRAGTRLSDEGIRILRESCDRFEELLGDEANMGALVEENFFFHQAILEGAGSPRLGTMVRQVIEVPLVYRSYIWYSPEQQQISSHYHSQIMRALEARDSERAELVMKEHIFEARDVLLAHWRELEAEE
jgi:DNA-binding GntR family transcriptional regulator